MTIFVDMKERAKGPSKIAKETRLPAAIVACLLAELRPWCELVGAAIRLVGWPETDYPVDDRHGWSAIAEAIDGAVRNGIALDPRRAAELLSSCGGNTLAGLSKRQQRRVRRHGARLAHDVLHAIP